MTVLGPLADAVGVGGSAVVLLAVAWYLWRGLSLAGRVATWLTFGVVVLAAIGLLGASPYGSVNLSRLARDAGGVLRWVVRHAVPWVVRHLPA